MFILICNPQNGSVVLYLVCRLFVPSYVIMCLEVQWWKLYPSQISLFLLYNPMKDHTSFFCIRMLLFIDEFDRIWPELRFIRPEDVSEVLDRIINNETFLEFDLEAGVLSMLRRFQHLVSRNSE